MVVSKFVRFGVPTRLMVLTLAILTAGAFVTLGLSGCAKTSTQAPPAEKAMQQDPNSLHGSGGRYLIDPDAQMRWSYSSLPDPAPSVKPNYLLKSFLFDVGASSLNSEARGTLGDLTEMLKSKPEVSVLCLGLCDGNKESERSEPRHEPGCCGEEVPPRSWDREDAGRDGHVRRVDGSGAAGRNDRAAARPQGGDLAAQRVAASKNLTTLSAYTASSSAGPSTRDQSAPTLRK